MVDHQSQNEISTGSRDGISLGAEQAVGRGDGFVCVADRNQVCSVNEPEARVRVGMRREERLAASQRLEGAHAGHDRVRMSIEAAALVERRSEGVSEEETQRAMKHLQAHWNRRYGLVEVG